MPLYEIGRLDFDLYYHEDFEETGLCCIFEILDSEGKHLKVIEREDVPPENIGKTLAYLYAEGWQMIQLTESFNLDEDGRPEIWFREAYFHRPHPSY